jgi:hypothetical protein
MEKSKIFINQDIPIDLPTLIESRLLVQANSGGGKSWLLRRLLEQSHGKVQQIIIDPEGEFATLREKYDYILAGKGGDAPADARSAELLARRLLELNTSAIIDLYELHPQERKRFVRLFLESLINVPKELYHPCLVVIDEAHTFAPENGESEAMDAVIGLAALGRKRQFCAVLATQRISKLHKDVAAECNNKLIGRTGLDIDRKRAGEELGFTSKEQFLSLRTLAAGEFYAFGPAISMEVQKVKVGDVETTHHQTGIKDVRVIPPTAKIKEALKKLADLPQEAVKQALTVSELQASVRTLTRENSELKRNPGVTKTPVPEKIVEKVPIIRKEHIANIIRAAKRFEKAAPRFETLTKVVNEAMREFNEIGRKLETFSQNKQPLKQIHIPVRQSSLVIMGGQHGETIVKQANNEITGPMQRILDALAWLESIGQVSPEEAAVAFLAGYTIGGGAFNNPRGALRTAGLINHNNGYMGLTDAGRAVANQPTATLTTEEIQRKVMDRLPGPEKKLLEQLVAVYPEGLGNEDLAARTGYAPNGGAFNNPRGRLRTLGLIEYQNGISKARPILFVN